MLYKEILYKYTFLNLNLHICKINIKLTLVLQFFLVLFNSVMAYKLLTHKTLDTHSVTEYKIVHNLKRRKIEKSIVISILFEILF